MLFKLRSIRNNFSGINRNNVGAIEFKKNMIHFTGSFWLFDKLGEQALLTHHAKLDKWFQFGWSLWWKSRCFSSSTA
ncbi:MAG: hypothetical protein WDZ41_03285 [Candidatus Babeliales bacterium]